MTQNQTSVCAPIEGKGKGMFINPEQLHSTHCVLEPNTPAPESFVLQDVKCHGLGCGGH